MPDASMIPNTPAEALHILPDSPSRTIESEKQGYEGTPDLSW
jgi:hypothetical protein